MKVPPQLLPLLGDGLIDAAVRPLRSGKEAAAFVVRCGHGLRCAKAYEDAGQRGFRQVVNYQEGRKVHSRRQARAMEKRTRHGRREQEAVWHNAEVDALYRLAAAGDAAPRLGDLTLSAEEATDCHAQLIGEVVRMLCAGMVHGDLSEYNVLLTAGGPVIIDLPQVVDASANNNARALLERDVASLAGYLGCYAPLLLGSAYGPQIWRLYAAGALHPDSILSGQVEADTTPANVGDVLREIDAACLQAEQRQAAREAACH